MRGEEMKLEMGGTTVGDGIPKTRLRLREGRQLSPFIHITSSFSFPFSDYFPSQGSHSQ